ncbi:C40 family peptidase [uncultured Modestobacter sp.]|uniref:C40 family peptidase n=1 Tax=uncultured Modestobacter sp. TaxID=380048 RepID=UPI00261CF6AF|nr:C40 family peptidase [uncultured Modestobacter sp.]
MATSQHRVRSASLSALAQLPHGPRRTRLVGRLGTGLLTGLVASLTLAVLPGSAAAAPATQAGSADEATRLAGEATHELEVVTEQLNEAQEVLAQQRAAATAAEQAVAAAQAQLATLDAQMRQVAVSAFTGENLSRFNALMTSGSADEFIVQVTTLDAIAGHTNDVLAEVTAAAATAQQAKADADAAAATAEQTLADITARQADLGEQISEYKAQYEALSVVQQQAVVQQHTGPVLEAPEVVVASSDAAQTAVDTALAQLGDPYVWGAGGPDAYDCSGLTQYAYAAAGISLPHSSLSQSRMGTPVSRGQLQPGDLVFFYSPVSHVGIYIGNGQMVHASTFGQPVIVSSVDMAGYASARRLVG